MEDDSERRFPLSRADVVHEFSERPQLAVRLIRGTYFSIHDNRGPALAGVPEKYNRNILLLHSEKNRFKFLCDQLMGSWLPEFAEFVRLLASLEPPELASDGAAPFDPPEEALWQAESFGISVLPDCYRVGYLGGGPAPMFASKDLLLGVLELVAEGLTIVGENLEFSTAQVLHQLRELKSRVVVPGADPAASAE